MSAESEVISTKCICKRNEGGECDCVCSAPCPGQAEGKVLDWTCECSTKRGKSCVCKFKLRCTREDGGKCCGDQPPQTELYTCDCACGSGECSFRVRKCACCEIVRTECGGCGVTTAGDAPSGCAAQKPEGCCGGGGCCKN